MKLLYLTMASLLEAASAQDTNCDRTRSDLCEFEVKTGLRKQCVYRYVLDVSNPKEAAYLEALKLDPDLTKGNESWTCYNQADVEAVLLTHNIKDPSTTVTNSYTVSDIPAGTAYNDPLPAATTPEEFL